MVDKDDEMDRRCPRALESMPTSYCPLAVMRLRAIRTAGRELTEEEESKLPGCPWSVNHQLANYCFFKYIKEYAGDKSLSDLEIASLNCVSVETVKKTEKNALSKIRATKEFSSLKDSMEGESIVTEQFLDDEHNFCK